MNIGLTGGIACGKSTVADLLVARGALLIDADQIAKEIVVPNSPALFQVTERFGQSILQPDGALDRKRLGELIFNEPAARKDLEAILHPAIRKTMWDRMHQWEADQPRKLVVVDIPLLYESELQQYFQEVMVVYVSKEIQLQRLLQRDKLTLEQAKQRLQAQMSIEEKKRLADIVIDNSGTVAETDRQLDAFWRERVCHEAF